MYQQHRYLANHITETPPCSIAIDILFWWSRSFCCINQEVLLLCCLCVKNKFHIKKIEVINEKKMLHVVYMYVNYIMNLLCIIIYKIICINHILLLKDACRHWSLFRDDTGCLHVTSWYSNRLQRLHNFEENNKRKNPFRSKTQEINHLNDANNFNTITH